LKNRVRQHVLTNPHPRDKNFRYINIPIGQQKEIEIFPSKVKNCRDDIEDTLPVLFRVQGLEEGKKYQFEIQSSLCRKNIHKKKVKIAEDNP